MALSYGVWLVILGILGASSLIIAKRPDAAQMIGKVAPYQGWFGAASFFYGMWELIDGVLHVGALAIIPLFWILWMTSAVLQIALGLLLGVGVMKSFIKAPAAHEKMDMTIRKLAPFQGILGIIAIVVGIVFTVVGLV